jgi:ADP-heptose:LPS heptosyltransferase
MRKDGAVAKSSGIEHAANDRARLGDIRAIIVFACNLLGDTICRLPAVQAAKDAYPAARLIVVADPGCREVFEGQGFVDDVWVLRRDRGALSQAAQWMRLLARARQAGPDMALDLYGSKRTALLSRLSGARHRAGLHEGGRSRHYTLSPDADAGTPRHDHIIQRINAAVVPAGVRARFEYCSLAVSEEDRRSARDALQVDGGGGARPLVVLNPGARVVAKRWPPERLGELAGVLSESGHARCVVVNGPGQTQLAEEVVRASKGTASALPQVGLKTLAALLEAVDLLVTGDTGVLHVGAAMGTPSVVIAGPTKPALFSGPGPKQIVLFHEGACEQWREGDECPRGNSCGDRTCIEAVTVEKVAAAVRGLLGEG